MAAEQVQGSWVVRWESGAARHDVQRRRRRLGRVEGEGGLWVQFYGEKVRAYGAWRGIMAGGFTRHMVRPQERQSLTMSLAHGLTLPLVSVLEPPRKCHFRSLTCSLET